MIGAISTYNRFYAQRRTRTTIVSVTVQSPDCDDEYDIDFTVNQWVEEDGYVSHERVVDQNLDYSPDWLTDEMILGQGGWR